MTPPILATLDVHSNIEPILRLVLAMLAGGLVGIERELRGRQPGFRTNVLVCLGSALVMVVSIHFATYPWQSAAGVNINVDPARLAYGVMTGVGFLGAGAILHAHDGGIRGLTTAAALWCVAAVGLALGFGLYAISAAATVMIIASLWLLEYVEDLLPRQRQRMIALRTTYLPDCIEQAISLVQQEGVQVIESNFLRSDNLTQADIDLLVMFVHPEQFEAARKRIENDGRYHLVGLRKVQ